MSDKAMRDNVGKEPVHMVPPEIELMLAKIYEFGATKYEKDNWRKGTDWSVCYASAQRHLKKWWSHNYEDLDEESKLSHLWHALWNVATLAIYEQERLGADNRYKKPSLRDGAFFVQKIGSTELHRKS